MQAVRLWTHGWDFFAPTENVIWHLWTREHRPSFRELFSPADAELEQKALEFVKRLCGYNGSASVESSLAKLTVADSKTDAPASDVASASAAGDDAKKSTRGFYGPMGLGSARTLEQYEALCGVDFRAQSIAARAKFGGLDPALFKDDSVKAAQFDLVMRLVGERAASSGAGSSASSAPAKRPANALAAQLAGFLG